MNEEIQKKDTIPKARSIDWLIALGLFLLFTVVYWLTISKDPTIDSYATAHWVKSAAQLNWFHPHHLLFSYVCRFVNLVYQTIFPPLDLLLLLTRCMHILGGLGVGLFYLRLYALNVPRFKAASIAILMGTGYGMWLFSTIFELVMPYYVMFLAAWAAAHRWGQTKRRGAFAAGMVLGAGVLIHQSLVIYLPAFLIFIFMLGDRPTRWQRALCHLIGCATVICAGYIMAFVVLGLEFPAGCYHFFTTYAQSEAFEHGTLFDVITSGRVIMSVWLYPILYADQLSFRFTAAMVVLITFVLSAIYRTVKKDLVSTFCLTVFATAFVFFTWWSPATLDFYLIPAVMIVLPMLLWIRLRLFPLLLLVVSLWLVFLNNLPEIRLHAEPQVNCVLETDRDLKDMLKPQDRVFWANQLLDACAAYVEMPVKCDFVVKDFNEAEKMSLFSKSVKNSYSYSVYFDASFFEMVTQSGMLTSDEELALLMRDARIALHQQTSSKSIIIWKIQRDIPGNQPDFLVSG